VYRKRFVHASEEPYFVAGEDTLVFSARGVEIGAAICADVGQPQHAADAARLGAQVYAAGVAKTPEDTDRAIANMTAHAKTHNMLAVMANHASATGGLASGGRSAAWNEKGELVVQAKAEGECVVVVEKTPVGWRGKVIEV
jgi:predicted amidohydrolase